MTKVSYNIWELHSPTVHALYYNFDREDESNLLEVKDGPVKKLSLVDKWISASCPGTCPQTRGINGRSKPGLVIEEGEINSQLLKVLRNRLHVYINVIWNLGISCTQEGKFTVCGSSCCHDILLSSG